MDSVFARFVTAAEEIRTSGRWEAVNAAIEALAASPGPDGVWRVEVFGALAFRVFSEYSALRRAYEQKRDDDSSLLAWRARNLLELSVWSAYCAASTENARRFYADAGRDAANIFSAFYRWGELVGQEADWLDPLAGAKDRLSARASAKGIETLEGPYKRVRDAARETGTGDNFNVSYMFLSKFAHPTAMRILAPHDEEKNTLQRDCFFGQGCLFFAGAIEALERALTIEQ
jgi:hypothetical protein